MKRKNQVIVCAAAASFLACVALAQAAPDPKTESPDYSRQPMPHSRADQLNGAAKASELIGMTVKNYQDEKIGKVADLAVDVESGRIVQVIVSTGGFLGIGDSLTAVPPGALHHDVANKVVHLDISKEKLKGAPQFDTAKWDEGTESNRVMETYAFYGEQPYFITDHDASIISNPDLNHYVELPRNQDGTINTDGSRAVDKARNAELAGSVEANSNTISTRNPDGTWTRQRYANGNGATAPDARLGFVQKASKLMGAAVKNRQDEKLGKVENFMVDLSAGRIVAVIISSGGFLGMGDELSAVPPSALRFDAEHTTLQLDASKEMLAGAPHFKASEWPDLSQPAYVGGVYRAYKVEPYFTSAGMSDTRTTRTTDTRVGSEIDADNTRQNVRDRDSRTLTPLDQGNSKSDLATTAQIRKEIIADKTMTVNARNVKIITKDGRVTLRGPVNTAEERSRICEIANRVASAANVTDQLEVAHRATPTAAPGN